GVLITSRKRSDAPGSLLEVKRLDELPAAEAFRLYSRGTACCAPTAADETTVHAVCEQLGGWPLALRIAGHYLRSTGESAADYLRWLEKEPLKELGDGEHQEENAALLLRRSVMQVSDDARLALSVAGTLAFAPIARTPVAVILEDDERRARKALGELVNYGLLEKREERWQVSHALVHTYAHTELGLSREALIRLAKYYIAFCRIQIEAGLPGYARLNEERTHYLQLMQSCLKSKLWQAEQYLEGAIAVYLDRQGYWLELRAALEMRLTAAKQSGNLGDQCLSLHNLGYTCERRGEYEQALVWYEQSLTIACDLGDRKGEGVTLNNIAEIYRKQDKHELALHRYEQSLSIARNVGDQNGEARSLNNIGLLYESQDDYETALQFYEQCLPIWREVGDKIGKGATLNNIASVYHAQGNYRKALKNHKQALAIRREHGDRAGDAESCWNIGNNYAMLSDLAQAEEHIALAVQVAEQIGHPSLEKYRDGLAGVRAALQGTEET
ncbi:MAG: hypothetical protein D3906_05400, partial [Candidatus Electrothrix sp. AUS1_2]|nr:hypothetical protein [Candidatus Electrothrix sp. AUS1_2]